MNCCELEYSGEVSWHVYSTSLFFWVCITGHCREDTAKGTSVLLLRGCSYTLAECMLTGAGVHFTALCENTKVKPYHTIFISEYLGYPLTVANT